MLRTTRYLNTSEAPTVADRTIQFTVQSGGMTSDVATSTVSIEAVNDPPQVGADAATVIVFEGDVVTNSGTHSDVDSTVSLSASVGTVIDNGNGTWSWSWDNKRRSRRFADRHDYSDRFERRKRIHFV